jgi:hypothetical protein
VRYVYQVVDLVVDFSFPGDGTGGGLVGGVGEYTEGHRKTVIQVSIVPSLVDKASAS